MMDRRRFFQLTGTFLLAVADKKTSAGSATASPSTSGSNSDKLTIFLGGDVMTARGIDRILPFPSQSLPGSGNFEDVVNRIQRHSGAIPEKVDFDYIWGDALAVLDSERPDFRMVNLETSITTSDKAWPGKSILYRMNPKNVPVLKAADIDCCALANNHVLDFSAPGLGETLDTLAGVNIKWAGAGRNLEEASAPAEFKLPNAGTLRVYSVADNASGAPDDWAARKDRPGVNHVGWLDPTITRTLEERIRSEKQPGDLALVSIHWGGNWGYEVPRDQRTFARRLIIAGADVVHGHSSHHVKGIEVYRGRPILYGAGDLINDYEGRVDENDVYRGELTLLYFVSLNRTSGNLERLIMYPMRISKFRLQQATESEAHWLGQVLDREGNRLNTGFQSQGRFLELVWKASD